MSQQPGWLTRLSKGMCECINLVENLPVGCHYHQEGDTFEITLFIAPTEFIGGPHDGERASTSFIVDVNQMLEAFDLVETVSWQAHQIDESDQLGSHFAIVGRYEGRHVWVRILAEAPPHIAPGRYANTLEQRFVDAWSQE